MIRKTKALVAVLNWGLGHATRTIPIIQRLIRQENEIVLASDGGAYDLLIKTFPSLPIHRLPGYDVSYPTSNMVWNMGIQLPKIYKAIKEEHHLIQKLVRAEGIQTIISDNRYGCYSSSTHNILISHQLNLQLPAAGFVINQLHARLINRFGEVWVPDDEYRTLSGSLSDPKWLAERISVSYIGAQSRLSHHSSEIQYDVAAVLSGPEPQRTNLEKELKAQLLKSGLHCILIKGKADSNADHEEQNLKTISFASETALSEIISASRLIVSRSGYSTIMDLHRLKKPALYIPTPGQTEQIYLAQRMVEKQLGIMQEQGRIDLLRAWKEISDLTTF